MATHNQNPGNPELGTSAERFCVAAAPAGGYPPAGFEQIVIRSVKFANAEQWREQMGTGDARNKR